MRTVTEFFGSSFTQAFEIEKGLVSSGKTPEELPAAREAAIAEAYKFEGEKLKHFLGAIEAASAKPERIKRVLVLAIDEKDQGKTPRNAVVKEGFAYIVEHYPNPHGSKPEQKRGERDFGGKGKGDRKKGRGKGRGGRDGREGREGREGERRPRRNTEGGAAPRAAAPKGTGGLIKPAKETAASTPQTNS